jgi:hypothetical protein
VSFAVGVGFVDIPRRVSIGEFGYVEDHTWDSCNCSMFTPEDLLLHGHHLLPVILLPLQRSGYYTATPMGSNYG